MKRILIISVIAVVTILSSDSKAQWVTQFSSSPAQTISSLNFYDDNTGFHTSSLFNGSTLNIYKTTNGGANYTAQNSSYTSQRFMSVWIIHPDTVFISGNYGKILRTYNGGINWTTVNSDTTIQYWGLEFVNSFTGYAAGSFGKVIKTTNRGDNWSTLNTGISNALDGIFFLNESTGYIGGSNVIMKTTNAGENWMNLPGIFISFETATAIVFTDENTGYYSTNAGRIVKTTDAGSSWAESYFASGVAVWGLSFTSASTGYGCRSDGTVIKTTDAGGSWGVQSTPLSENLYELDFPSANTGYIGTWSGKILKTTNGGLTFTENNSGIIPASLSIEKVFPNPFNPSVKISYTVHERSEVELRICDINGRTVESIVKQTLDPGSYEATWVADEMPAGVYFATISDKRITLNSKLVLLK